MQRSQGEKLKAILEALNTNNARKVLQELEQPNPKVKKILLFKLIIEIASNHLLQKVCHLNQIIQLQKKQIENLQNFVQKLEIINIELCFKSIQHLKDFQYKIFDRRIPVLQNIVELSNQLQEQQTELFQKSLQQENQIKILANSNHENQELGKILSMVQSYIQKSESILQVGKQFQQKIEYQQTNKDVQEYIQNLTNIIEKNQYFFIKLKETLSEQNKCMSNYEKQSFEIDETYKMIDQANIKEEKEQLNKIKQTLEQQGYDKIE